MTLSRKCVVCLGKDKVLLETRRLLLEHAGYAACATSQPQAVAKHLAHGEVSILILCHTISSDEAGAITRFHHDIRSTASILYLTVGGWNATLESGKVHDAQKGPAAFLAAVNNLSAVYKRLNRSSAIAG